MAWLTLAMETWVALLAGAALGIIAGWLVARKLTSARTDAVETELRAQLQQRETELTATRSTLTDRERLLAANEAQAKRVPDLERSQTEAQTQIAALKERVGNAEAQAQAAAKQLGDQQKQHERALAELESKFAALSAQALDKNSKSFLTLAQETLARFQEGAKGDLSVKQKEIEKLLQPLQQNLKQYQERLQQTETEQSKTLGELRQRLVTLDAHSVRLEAETSNLVSALKSPQTRGRWGEITLQRVVEVAGLSRHCDFDTQVSTDTEEGRLRPDLVVRLPQNKTVVVDSKVPPSKRSRRRTRWSGRGRW